MKKFNKGGRPLLPEKNKRNKIIKICLTDGEYKFIEEHAARAGHRQIARFLYSVLISLVKDGGFEYVEVAKINNDFIVQLIGLSNSVSQLTHILHQHPTHTEAWEAVDETLLHISSIITMAAEIAVGGIRKKSKMDERV